MKICYLNHDLRVNTGAGRFGIALIEAMRKVNPGADLKVITSEDLLAPNKIKLLLLLPKIRKVLKNCDVIHALDGWPYGVIAALASLGLKKKLIITAIGTGGVKPLYSFWKRPILKWVYRRADRVTAVSNNTKKEILKFLPNLDIEVINHGVEFTKYEKVRTYEKYQKLKPYILSVGAWKSRKGFEYSIQAFEKIKDKFPYLKYVVLSKAPEEIKRKYNRILFVENLSETEMIALYQNAELFILLPQDINKDLEGFGLVFLEAAAAGLPVIATKNTSAEDAVRDGKNGILVEPSNYQEAAMALEKILSQPELKKSFSAESVKFAKEMSWEKTAKEYARLY